MLVSLLWCEQFYTKSNSSSGGFSKTNSTSGLGQGLYPQPGTSGEALKRLEGITLIITRAALTATTSAIVIAGASLIDPQLTPQPFGSV